MFIGTSKRPNGARKAVMAGLATTLAFGSFATPATIALAATAGQTGTVTITQLSNAGATYDGYRLVKADVDAEDKGSRFEWENDATKTAVLAFLDQTTAQTGASKTYAAWLTENGHTAAVNGVAAHDLPQNAMEYIAAQVAASNEAVDTDTDPETKQHDTFVDNLAQYLKNTARLSVTGTASTGVAFEGAQGYYLFTTTGATLATEEVGTAPIFVALGATPKQVTEKSAIPTIDKQVKEDKTGTFGRVADGNKDQDLDFRLFGTLPTNYDAFDMYHMQFNDTLPAGMSLKGGNTSSVKVYVYANQEAANGTAAGTDITSQLTGTKGSISYADDLLTVNIADLRQITGVTFTKDSVIRVDYSAHCDADAIIGSAGNDNTVTLTYTNDPVTRGDGVTNPKQNKVCTYQLQVVKVDHDTRETLAGAKFTIQVAEGGQSDAASVGKYLQADGSLSTTAYEFTTGSDGTFTVPRIDEGKYIVHETVAPNGYELLSAANGDSDVTIEVTATKDQTAGTVTALAMTAQGGNGPDGMSASATAGAHEDGVLEAAVDTGSLKFRVSNDKEIYLPGTGLTPSAAGTIAGLTMIIAGVGVVVMRQRKQNDLSA